MYSLFSSYTCGRTCCLHYVYLHIYAFIYPQGVLGLMYQLYDINSRCVNIRTKVSKVCWVTWDIAYMYVYCQKKSDFAAGKFWKRNKNWLEFKQKFFVSDILWHLYFHIQYFIYFSKIILFSLLSNLGICLQRSSGIRRQFKNLQSTKVNTIKININWIISLLYVALHKGVCQMPWI